MTFELGVSMSFLALQKCSFIRKSKLKKIYYNISQKKKEAKNLMND